MTKSSDKQIRLLIVDDHPVVRIGLRNALGQMEDINVVGDVGTAAMAIQEAARLKPDVVLMDIRLPDGNGSDACMQIVNSKVNTRVLMVSSYYDEQTVFRAITAGADGYLVKNIDVDRLAKHIREVAAGETVLDTLVTRQLVGRIREPVTQNKSDCLKRLSLQERRVAEYIAEGKTNKEIGALMGLAGTTIKNYAANVFTKLNFNRRSQVAAFVSSNTSG